jgi:hypothetical protein
VKRKTIKFHKIPVSYTAFAPALQQPLPTSFPILAALWLYSECLLSMLPLMEVCLALCLSNFCHLRNGHKASGGFYLAQPLFPSPLESFLFNSLSLLLLLLLLLLLCYLWSFYCFFYHSLCGDFFFTFTFSSFFYCFFFLYTTNSAVHTKHYHRTKSLSSICTYPSYWYV